MFPATFSLTLSLHELLFLATTFTLMSSFLLIVFGLLVEHDLSTLRSLGQHVM